ncbi:MAG: ion transporter [Eubacteriales bacterium]
MIYQFTPWAIIDLISILPSFSIIGNGFRILRVMRLIRSIRVFRAFKILRYSHNIKIIARVFKKQRNPYSPSVY